MKILEALSWASSFFIEKVDAPRLTAEMLLCGVLEIERHELFARLGDALAEDRWEAFQQWVSRRGAGEPLQHILGEQSFYGLPFRVNCNVLIPRPETELLVEETLRHAKKLWGFEAGKRPLNVADLGTGSGVIAVTLAHLCPAWQVWAVDISSQALSVAEQNARRILDVQEHLDVQEPQEEELTAEGKRTDADIGRLHFRQGSFCEPLVLEGIKVDLLISNPPYIPRGDLSLLEKQVRDYEPHLALDGGEDGLDAYRLITGHLLEVLSRPALVALEVGIHQAEKVAELLQRVGCSQTVQIPDYAGIPRMVFGWF